MCMKIVSDKDNTVLMMNSENNSVVLTFANDDNKDVENVMLYSLLSTYEDRVLKNSYLSNKKEEK